MLSQRQPWLVYGVLTAAQAASAEPVANIALTLAMYPTLYVLLLFAYVSVLFHLAAKAAVSDAAELLTAPAHAMAAASSRNRLPGSGSVLPPSR